MATGTERTNDNGDGVVVADHDRASRDGVAAIAILILTVVFIVVVLFAIL